MNRVASLSLDLDNKWSYLKTHGNPAWADFPSYLDVVIPRILDFLEQRDLKITFFIVGQDAALTKNHAALASIAAAGHEIASHSFNHDPWLHLYDEDRMESELEQAEQAIEAATGVRVTGFRGPGFSISKGVLSVLKKRGYRYDATAFPNLLNPLARAYFFARSDLSKEEKEKRKGLFGSFSDAFRPVSPYRWDLEGEYLVELPVTTMPLIKAPMHFSYLQYLSAFSPRIARAYFRFALSLCSVTRTSPSLLLHPLDFMGADDDQDLGFFPGMDVSSDKKLERMDEFISILTDNFMPLTIGEHMKLIEASGDLRVLQPAFAIK